MCALCIKIFLFYEEIDLKAVNLKKGIRESKKQRIENICFLKRCRIGSH